MALATVAALALLLAFGGAAASPRGAIVLHGAASGSHLQLSVSDEHLVVNGWMAAAEPAGCRLAQGRMLSLCRLDGAGSIELDMGPSGDRVEVLEPLPLPLTVYLGDGSDKFIGSDEADTCYSEGARRNRCIGGGGDDICITGQENSDCVGDSGDDYCQTGAGSDGCWGGPGDDVCRMGSGQDGCHGEEGRDRLYGGASADQLYGGGAYDHCDGLPGWGRSHECETGPGR
ncbi:MAG TPA: calcium-binding protein [Solirubrobacterales bacterium]|nr:calcium-binding protein [Solirubrobacterales bacterium]